MDGHDLEQGPHFVAPGEAPDSDFDLLRARRVRLRQCLGAFFYAEAAEPIAL
jgi:hypothetical protein